MKKIYLLILSLWLVFSLSSGANQAQTRDISPKQAKAVQNESAKKDSTTRDAKQVATPKVTFIELGSVNCIPCRMMQPVMKAVEEDYGDQIEVVFYDISKDLTPARKYRIRVIPTQVFLDEKGKEFFRHVGFFPKENIDSLLVKKGLKKIIGTSSKSLKQNN